MLRTLLCLSCFGLFNVTAAAGEKPARETSASQTATEDRFEIRNVEGWTVYTNRALFAEHPEETAQTLEHLRWELYQIKLAAPAQAVAHMQANTPIWMEWNEEVHLSYHPGRQWLLDRGYQVPADPQSMMSLSVKTHYPDSYRHPFAIFHEMAHAYDFYFTGQGQRYGNDEIQAAYDRMMETDKYENVLLWNGKYKSHYARSNRMEYWAESTEAYFAVNDFYPFVRAELRQFDPEQVRIIERYWGIDPRKVQQLEDELAAYLEQAEIAETCSPSIGYTPTNQYSKRDIDGWTVYVHPELAQEPGLCDTMVTLVAYKLHMIDHFISEQGQAELHRIPIWLENGSAGPYIQYCGNRAQMRRQGLNPDKFQAVEIRDPQRMLRWALLQQSDLLHCLALGYYDRHVAGEGSERQTELQAAFEQAQQSDEYGSVLRFDGRQVPHPGLRDEKAYFAKLMESYFLVNDHYPFIRGELKEQDPDGYEIVAGLWEGCPPR